MRIIWGPPGEQLGALPESIIIKGWRRLRMSLKSKMQLEPGSLDYKQLFSQAKPADIKAAFEAMQLLGNFEVKEQLGWSSSKVTNYYKRGVLPAPIGFISGRPVWTQGQIDKFKIKEGLK